MTSDKIFEYAIEVVRGGEGGYSDDPNDPGNYTPSGELKGTNYGISAASYPNLDIEALTWEDAKAIYLADFWKPIGGEYLPPALAVVALDVAINHGKARLREWFGEGPQTAVSLSQRRLEFYMSLDNWDLYSKGWTRRTFATFRAAQMLETQVQT